MRTKRNKLVSDINVVPYIDVMLVLLVIFMVAAPLMVQGIVLNLPEVSSKDLPKEPSDPLVISVDSEGLFFLEMESTRNTVLSKEELLNKVTKILNSNQDLQVFVRGDSEARYKKVMELMSLLQKAGAKDVGLITQPPEESK